MSKPARAPAASFVVFGGTGDLTKRLLAPALVNLSRDGLLDDGTRLIGVGRSGGSDDELRDSLAEFVDDKDDYAWLRERITYLEGDFTGDALFPGGHGRTENLEDHISLMNDLEKKVFDRLPDPTWFYPGHGGDSTLGVERPHLGEWRERGW